jgi:NAD(P)-dependent dehydrogenase (short-subunit alcohol dehydrogenase family)
VSLILVGAGPGLGRAIARRFGGAGWPVGLIGRGAPALATLAGELAGEGVTAAWQAADAGDDAGLTAAIGALEDRLGPARALVYNAAVMRAGEPLSLDAPRLRAEFDVNTVGALVAVQAVAPGMLGRGAGAILLTGGGLALEPYPEWTSLALGKAALRNLGFSLYKALAPGGVHVAFIAICGIVEPGGPFDPDRIAGEYWRLATAPRGVADRECVFRPDGADPFYNDPARRHAGATPPLHGERNTSHDRGTSR